MRVDHINHKILHYTHDHALVMAHMSSLAYDKEHERADVWQARVEVELQKMDVRLYSFFDVLGTQAFVAGWPNCIIVAFRGTEPEAIEDWATDLKAKKTGGPFGGRVHRGFKRALSVVWENYDLPGGKVFVGMETTIKRFQKQLLNTHKRIGPSLWFTGHSMGAALATLATADLVEDGHIVQGLYTFGSPRVGDERFSDAFDVKFNRHYRMVNNNDIVTRVPTRSMGYRHCGNFWYIGEDGSIDNDPSWMHIAYQTGLGLFSDLLEAGFDAVKDHAMVDYVTQLQKNA